MLVAALVLAASLPATTAASGDAWGDVAGALGPLRPQLGAWAEYLVRTPGKQDVRVRFAVVEPPPDRARAWVEVATAGERSIPFALRLLLNAATGKLERASLYALGQAPIEIPVDDGEAVRVAARPPRSIPRRTKTVTVSAGTFRATEWVIRRQGDLTRAWRADEVPLWGIVRARQAGRTIELLRFGDRGARSVLPPQGNGSESAQE